MNGIGNLLKKYLDFTPPEKAITRAVVKVLEEVFAMPFNESAITVRNQSIFVTTDSILKSEIIFRKQKILSRVQELVGGSLIDIK